MKKNFDRIREFIESHTREMIALETILTGIQSLFTACATTQSLRDV